MAATTLAEGGFGFSLDIMRCSAGSRQASSMWDETYIFCPLSHGTKYSSIGFMTDLLIVRFWLVRKTDPRQVPNPTPTLGPPPSPSNLIPLSAKVVREDAGHSAE